MSIASTALAINVSRDAHRLVVTLTGDLDCHGAPALGDVLLAASECQEQAVLVDLSGVEFVDSSGLTVLLSGERHLARAGSQLVVVDPSTTVTRLLEITGLDETIPVLRTI